MQRRLFIILSIVLIISFLFVGCKSADKNATMDSSPQANKENSIGNINGENGTPNQAADGNAKNQVSVPETNRKLIRNMSLSLETKEFDKLNSTITQTISQANGYIENSEISGNTYRSNGSRYCNMVIRIPKAKLDEFVANVSGLGTVVNKQESTQDVTLSYVDIESHKKALQVEQDRLLALLEKANKLEDIIALEQRLSQVRYEVQTYESQLRTYDNQVDYSTVQLSIREVEHVTQLDDGTMWSKIATGFSNSLVTLGNGFKAFFIWFASNILYLIIVAGLITLFVLWIRRLTRGKHKETPPPFIPTNLPPQQ